MNEENLGWQILEKIEQNRDWRRQHRREWLAEIADDLWSTMPDDEALDDFRLRLQECRGGPRTSSSAWSTSLMRSPAGLRARWSRVACGGRGSDRTPTTTPRYWLARRPD